MKKVELVVHDHLLRQILVLVAEEAKEVHVTDIGGEAPAPVIETAPVRERKPVKRQKSTAKAHIPTFVGGYGQTAREILLDYLDKNGTASNDELKQLSSARGYHPASLQSIANVLVRKGQLNRVDGIFSVPNEIEQMDIEPLANDQMKLEMTPMSEVAGNG